MIPADRYGMDPEQMRRVIVSIGKPRPSAMVWPTAPKVTVRLTLLFILLGLTILLGLVGRAGASGVGKPVQKGSARAQGSWISPLEKLDFHSPAAPPSLKNFLDNFAGQRPEAPAPALVLRPVGYYDEQPSIFGKPEEPTAAVAGLALFCLVVLWFYLRVQRQERLAQEWKRRRARR